MPDFDPNFDRPPSNATSIPVIGETRTEYIPSPDQYTFGTDRVDARYPANLGVAPFEKWMLFEVKFARHIGREGMLVEGKEKDKTLKSVALYLPPDALNSELSVTYDETGSYGNVGGAVVTNIVRALQSGKEVETNPAGAPSNGLLDKLKRYYDNTTRAVTGVAAAAPAGVMNVEYNAATKTLDALGTLLTSSAPNGGASVNSAAIIQNALGIVPNPRTDIFFQDVGYRTHDLSFVFIPRSRKEAQAIDQILNIFQFYMLPSYGADSKDNSYFIGYPYEFVISMFTQHNGSSHHINTIDRSVLENIQISHATENRVSFVDELGGIEYYPTSTSLRLRFKEVRKQGRDNQTSIWYGTKNVKPEGFKGENGDPKGDEGAEQRAVDALGRATGLG